MAERLKTYHLIPQQQRYEDLKIHKEYFHFTVQFFSFLFVCEGNGEGLK